ncbi:ROK family glucokinase [Alkalibacterium olivapovliticus]|uniref:Glucokinase n=1 Tax=Alkalibacterium olivapovliticus TaxID=99907 RepID=A0A2T0W8Y0_9LACT|nr:ROK family glucokinase [Alkalibacterium olivapovliticus]PRY83159.1 glucokinase [Alkalibacterium olivapovliticus]
MKKIAIGIDLGGTTIKFAFLTKDGQVKTQWAVPTPVHNSGRSIVPTIIESIQNKMIEQALTSDHIVAIGMGSPGSVDRANGTVTGAYNLGWVDTVHIKEAIEQALEIPFVLDNDANAAALGEQWMGAGQNEPNVVFLTLGTGVGGGVIVNGELVHGFLDTAGEIGHLKVEDNGFACTCGQVGCLETVASATGIVNVAKKEAPYFIESSALAKVIVEKQMITAKYVFESARSQDPLAEHVLKKVGQYLGIACANIANILNPSTIVLGGGVSKAGELLLSYVVPNFERNAFPTIAKHTAIKIATLENDAGFLGAASLAFESAESK